MILDLSWQSRMTKAYHTAEMNWRSYMLKSLLDEKSRFVWSPEHYQFLFWDREYDGTQNGIPKYAYPDVTLFSINLAAGGFSGESVTCVMCGKNMIGARKHAKTCSPKCRKALSRRTPNPRRL